MAKLSLPELQAVVTAVVTKANLSNASFVESRDNTAGLLDKIGEVVTIDTVYNIDKLARFDGNYLSFGKIIEEWQEDLILPQAYDSTGANALSPHDPTYRPVFYSYSIGRKVIATTIRYNDLERAVHNTGELSRLIALKYKRLEDSMAQYRYNVKREMIAKFYALCEETLVANVSDTYATSTAYSVNKLLKNSGGTAVAIVVKAIANSNSLTWDQAVAAGYLIVLHLIDELAVPTTTATGEAFILQVKKDVESAQDVSEGHSLNGNTLGAINGLTLVIKQGIMPDLDVNTLAGAFHLDKVAIPVDVVVVKDFGSATDPFAMLVDTRAMRLHNTFNAVYDNANGEGGFLNIFRHTEDTAYISRNAFVKFYKAA